MKFWFAFETDDRLIVDEELVLIKSSGQSLSVVMVLFVYLISKAFDSQQTVENS